jgi:hypothetical protein
VSNIVNGFGNPRFRILDQNDNLIEEIDLRITTGGLQEDYDDEDLTHMLEKDNEIVKVYNGGKLRIHFTLNYENYIKKDTLFKIVKIIQYEKANNYKIYIIPKADVLSRKYRVVYSGDSIQINIGKGGEYAVTNKGVIVKWTTKKLEFMNFIDQDDISVKMFFSCKN